MDRIAKIHFGRNRRQELNTLIENAIRERVFPGLELLVARDDQVLLHEAWGNLEVGPEVPVLETGTLFDIASITKPMATALCLMILMEQGRVGLEDKVSSYFPEYDTPDKRGITLRHLLTHTAGLPDWVDLYSSGASQAEALQTLVNEPLSHPTGTVMLYSDLGYLMLGEIIRRISGGSLSEFFHQQVAHPLGLLHTGFNPLAGEWDRPIAPTQFCTFRRELLRGVVHDENAFVFGGEGGNAGLFSTAADLHRFARMILAGGALDGVRVLSSRSVEVMTAQPQPAAPGPAGAGLGHQGRRAGLCLLRRADEAGQHRPYGLHRHLPVDGAGNRVYRGGADQPGQHRPGEEPAGHDPLPAPPAQPAGLPGRRPVTPSPRRLITAPAPRARPLPAWGGGN